MQARLLIRGNLALTDIAVRMFLAVRPLHGTVGAYAPAARWFESIRTG